jgi:hypothetical protein
MLEVNGVQQARALTEMMKRFGTGIFGLLAGFWTVSMPAAASDWAKTRPKVKNAVPPQGPQAHATGLMEML